MKPFTTVYSHVHGLVNATPIALRTAGYTSTLHQFLEPVYPALAIGWTMGFIFMMIRMAGGFYLSYHIARKDIFLPDPLLVAIFEKAKAKLRMPSALKLKMSSRQISPMVIGFIKPCVIVPLSILSGLNPEQVEAILVHELAHIRRYDHVVMIIQSVVTQILFFHPVAWYLSSEINRERENCCDDLVIKTFPNPINYIKALTMIQELNMDGQVPANALMGRSKRLLGRVKRLLKIETRHTPAFRMAGIFLLFITLGIVAITIASAGNAITKKSLGMIFTGKPEKPVVVTDTIKTKKQEKVIVKEESTNKEDIKKQKELEEASRKLEKAHKELEKARLEMEKAREEFARAGGRLRSNDLADLSRESQRPMIHERMREFNLSHEKASDVQRRVMELQRRNREDHMRLQEEAMRERMRQVRPEEWKHNMKEWENANKEMIEARKEFYKVWKDSDKIWVHPHIIMNIPPVAPIPPDVPSPDINMEIPEPDIAAPPEPVVPLELMKEQQEQHEQQDMENTKPLDSTLKELEGE